MVFEKYIKAKGFSCLLMLGVLAVFLWGSSFPVYASSGAHGSESHSGEHQSSGHGEHQDSAHSSVKEVHHGDSRHDTGHSQGKAGGYGSQEKVDSILPFVTVMLPLLTVIALVVTKGKGLEWTAYGTLATFLVNLLMAADIWNGKIIHFAIGAKYSVVSLSFFADSLSFLVGTIASFVWMLVSFYSIGYMAHEHSVKRYNIFSMLSFSGMMGVVYTQNLFSLYIFFELLSICSYVMVVHEEDEGSFKAGLKYIALGISGGLILFVSFVMIYTEVGTVDLLELAEVGGKLGQSPWLVPIFVGMMIGFGIKAGMFPLHIWLPEAHPVAPAPASALLSGVMIKAGGYGMIRAIYNIVGMDVMRDHTLLTVVLILACINIFLGSAMAIRAKEIKLLLAYSSIAQIGYVLLGATLLTPSSLIGAAVHIFNHAIIKGTLFMCAGAFIHQTSFRQLDDLLGIGRKMPIVMLCFTVASFSMIGFPPFNGFIGKWFLCLGALEVGEVGSFAFGIGVCAFLLLLLSSFMNLLYYAPILYGAWFKKRAGEESIEVFENADPGPAMLVPLVILATCTAIFGIFPHFPIHYAHQFSQIIFH